MAEVDFSKLSDYTKYVIEGENAKKIYDILQESYVGKNKKLPPSMADMGYQIEYRYEDGVLYIEEHTTGGRGGEVEFLLDFLIPYDGYYLIRERSENGVPIDYEVRDEEGKYFVRPPKTEHELQQDEKLRQIHANSDDMPF
ncbi:MAG: hypothetical protein IKW31_02060 [Alistipes sp.]|nr:hypothetical protein [Alistipes sp.]